jgi:hypothetical protein
MDYSYRSRWSPTSTAPTVGDDVVVVTDEDAALWLLVHRGMGLQSQPRC